MKNALSPGSSKPRSSTKISQDRMLLVTGGLFALMVCLALVLGVIYVAQPQLARLFASPSATPPCVEPRLSIGSVFFRIDSEPSGPGGALPASPADPGLAYWIEGTSPNYVLLLNSARENQVAAASLQAGMPVSANWADCTVDSYTVQAVESRPAFDLEQVDQSRGGITLFIPLDASGSGIVVTSGTVLPTAEPTLAGQEPPAPEGMQANINFVRTELTPDGQVLQVVIEVQNVGTTVIAISDGDIALAVEGLPDVLPTSLQPVLPLEIPPGETRPLAIEFPKPVQNPALFRLKDFTTDLYY